MALAKLVSLDFVKLLFNILVQTAFIFTQGRLLFLVVCHIFCRSLAQFTPLIWDTFFSSFAPSQTKSVSLGFGIFFLSYLPLLILISLISRKFPAFLELFFFSFGTKLPCISRLVLKIAWNNRSISQFNNGSDSRVCNCVDNFGRMILVLYFGVRIFSKV